ncbi:hypothetical protein CTI12_AA615120 [Artemisia annua]|uniref:Uncharacterized protein n=1 Tax=Artemisia annua TaxID=35608 RepID=A0A2U1KE10_ARTAN|nr:hypothetical protein CTI12_AA615120 [Artemisia annua]
MTVPETSLPRCVFQTTLRKLGIKLKKNVKAKNANNHTPRCRSAKSNKTGPKLSSHDEFHCWFANRDILLQLEAKLAKMCLTPYQSKKIVKSKDVWALSTPYNKRSPQNASQLEDTFAKMRLTPLSPQSGHDRNSRATGTLPGPF